MKASQKIKISAILSLLISSIFTVTVEALERLDPKEVINIWNNALYEGNLSVATKYTSITASGYIKNNWGSLEGLSMIYQQSINVNPLTIVNIQEIDGDVSTVKYYDGK